MVAKNQPRLKIVEMSALTIRESKCSWLGKSIFHAEMLMEAFVSAWMIRHTCVQKHPRELKEPGSKLFRSHQMRPELDPC